MNVPETTRIGDLCSIHRGFIRPTRVDGGRPIPVVRGRDLFREVLLREELKLINVNSEPPPHCILRQGDILMPTVTRRPNARVVGAALAGSYAHDTITILRPREGGPPPRLIAKYLTSPEFFEALTQVSPTLRDAFRIGVAALVAMPFRLPQEAEGLGTGDSVMVLVDGLARDLIALIARTRTALLKIEWRDLERLLATAFEGLGFEVELTPPSKDGGKDLVLSCFERGSRKRYAIEVKHWVSGKRVGGSELRKFLEVIVHEEHDSGLLLSTSGFARNAYHAVAHLEHKRMRLGGENKIVCLCRMFVASESGLWSPQDYTNDVFLDSTDDVASLLPIVAIQ